MAKTRVFKLQRALLSSEASPPVLAYDQHRRYTFHIPATPEVLALFKRGEHKIFHNATPHPDRLDIGERVKPRTW